MKTTLTISREAALSFLCRNMEDSMIEGMIDIFLTNDGYNVLIGDDPEYLEEDDELLGRLGTLEV